MARIRVFLPTYRRPGLLPRALGSLRSQTFGDWVCEVHNDDPLDEGPRMALARLGDPRIVLRQHERNLGGVETFNLVFRSCSEPFYSLLEDDNWWEPDFLESMLTVAEAHPASTVFWANQRVWKEEPDGRFTDTGGLVQPDVGNESPRSVPWGQRAQIFGAVHSNGAMLVRSRPGEAFATPRVPFSVVEGFRERLFPYPLVFVPKPLAHFSLTLKTARSADRGEWVMMQVMLAATYLKHAGYGKDRFASLWSEARSQRPPSTTTLLLASLIEPKCRGLRSQARPADWFRLARGSLRRPAVLLRVLRAKRNHPDWWDWLDRHTAARFAEARSVA